MITIKQIIYCTCFVMGVKRGLLRVEHRLRVFEDKVSICVIGLTGGGGTERLEKNYVLNSLIFILPQNIVAIKARRTRWTEHVARTREMTYPYILDRRTKVRDHSGEVGYVCVCVCVRARTRFILRCWPHRSGFLWTSYEPEGDLYNPVS
jgi:hypothetical protein